MSLTTRKYSVTGLTLKWIAIVTMLIDHIGVISYGWLGWSGSYLLLRRIGRIAFPIFAFLLTEGFRHTRNRRIYLRNLLIFAVISEIPYDFVNTELKISLSLGNFLRAISSQNIFWALSLGLLGIMGAEAIVRLGDKWRLPRPVSLLCALIPMAAALCASEVVKVDYHHWSVLLILMVYSGETAASCLIHNEMSLQMARNVGAAIALLFWALLYDFGHGWLNESYGIVAAVPILLYNGERGQYRLPKWFFYGFYPAHLLILHALRLTVIPWLLGAGPFR